MQIETAFGTRQTAARLHATLSSLRHRVADLAEARMAGWSHRIVQPSFEPSARNLAAYLALRSEDLREVQRSLTALGLSTLGRAEAHVLASLDAVTAALAAIGGLAPCAFPPESAFAEGERLIAARRDAIFGPGSPGGPMTRILATLPGNAAGDAGFFRALVAAGVDAVRINSAHDGPDVWHALIEGARAAGAEAGRRIAVAMDLGGPKVRIVATGGAKGRRFLRGDRFRLVGSPQAEGPEPWAVVSHAALLDRMTPGAAVWIDDGKLRAAVVERRDGAVTVEVTGTPDKGAKLKPEKGVAMPGTDLDIPSLTDRDRDCIAGFAGVVDVFGCSFVQTVADVEAVQAALAGERQGLPPAALILKIETARALRNLPDLIVAAGGAGPVAVMIARGDLAVSLGLDRLSEVQDEILWLCEAAHVPSVWATQVLDDLLHGGLPSRAEATDAAMGQRADCVMLNKGPHAAEAVAFLRSILLRMDRHQARKFAHLGRLRAWASGL